MKAYTAHRMAFIHRVQLEMFDFATDQRQPIIYAARVARLNLYNAAQV